MDDIRARQNRQGGNDSGDANRQVSVLEEKLEKAERLAEELGAKLKSAQDALNTSEANLRSERAKLVQAEKRIEQLEEELG